MNDEHVPALFARKDMIGREEIAVVRYRSGRSTICIVGWLCWWVLLSDRIVLVAVGDENSGKAVGHGASDIRARSPLIDGWWCACTGMQQGGQDGGG